MTKFRGAEAPGPGAIEIQAGVGHSYGKIHHAINGKIHYFDWAIFDSYVSLPDGI